MRQTIDKKPQSDIIYLGDIWQALVKRKVMILVLTLIITAGSVGYTKMAPKAKPVYRGSAIMEIGKMIYGTPNFSSGYPGQGVASRVVKLDNLYDLGPLLREVTGVKVRVEKAYVYSSVFTISTTGHDKSTVKKKLEEAISFTLNRHKEMAKHYSNQHSRVIMTKVVGGIKISDTTKRRKKSVTIVAAFVGGLIFSIFLALFLEFIVNRRTKND